MGSNQWNLRIRNQFFILSILLLILLLSPIQSTNTTLEQNCPLKIPSGISRRPAVIAFRGAAYSLPEHTLPAFRLALELGADAVKVDLVPTKDFVLIAMHSLDLSETTNVAEIYPNRKRTKSSGFWDENGKKTSSGYFADDFTLAEIKDLRVKQRLDDGTTRDNHFDLQFPIPTLTEIIDMLYEWNRHVRPTIGAEHFHTLTRPSLQLELWAPNFIQKDTNDIANGDPGINVANLLLEEIRHNPKAKTLFFDPTECSSLSNGEYITPPLVLQAYNRDILRYLSKQIDADPHSFGGMIPPLIYLVPDSNWETPEARTKLWDSMDGDDSDDDHFRPAGLGVSKSCFTHNRDRGLEFMAQATMRNMAVHPYVEHMELTMVSSTFRNAEEELHYLFCDMGVDGIVTENVDLAVNVGEAGCGHMKVNHTHTIDSILEKQCMKEEEEMLAYGIGCLLLGSLIGWLWVLCICRRKKRAIVRQMKLSQLETDELTMDHHHHFDFDQQHQQNEEDDFVGSSNIEIM